MIDVIDKYFVLLCQFEHGQKTLFPGSVSPVFFEYFFGVLNTYPFHEVVHVLEMIVKGLSVYSAVVGNVLYRDFIEFFLFQKIFKRRRYGFLGYVAHSFSSIISAELSFL